MKKTISLFLILALLTGALAVSALADGKTFGTLSYLNMTEEDSTLYASVRMPMLKFLILHGVLTSAGDKPSGDVPSVYRYYDSLDALLMALQAGELGAIRVPSYTARYLCSMDAGLKMLHEYHPENATGAAELALNLLSDGYSFMMQEKNTELRDAFDAQITAMKEDGTLQKLIDEHIVKASEGGEPTAVAFEKYEGDPIKVAVTGSLPPMDYVAPDGSFAGFNTAVLAEIGKRLQKNIELVQVDSIGRALALSEGTVDVVFWTRGPSDSLAGLIREKGEISNEDREALRAERRETMTSEEKAILDEGKTPDQETIAKLRVRDMPAGTIITQPYFTDFQVQVTLK